MSDFRPLPIGSLVLVAVVLLAMLVTYWLVRPPAPPAELEPVLEREFRPLAPFQLNRHRAAPLTERNLRGQWSLFTFGYLACGDDCAAALRELARLRAALADDSDARAAPTQVVYVSVDPDRDDSERLAEYVAHFDRGFIGATAGRGQIDRLTAQFGVARDPAASGPERYALDGSIYLVDPFGRHVASFDAPHSAATLREQYRLVTDYYARRGARAAPPAVSVVAFAAAAARLAPGPGEIGRDQRDVDNHADDEKADRRVGVGARGFGGGLLADGNQPVATGNGVVTHGG